MCRIKSVMEKIKEAEKIINPHYDASSNNINEIVENSDGIFELVSNGFTLGYLQGTKAEKARRKVMQNK